MTRRVPLLVLAVLVLTSALAPAAAVATGDRAADATPATTVDSGPRFEQASGNATTPTNGTNTTDTARDTDTDSRTDGDGNTSGPAMASIARLSPLQTDEPWLSVRTAERDRAYNTSGPFVTFTVSEPLEAVRIAQPKANARILGNGRIVRVQYADDAAPPGKTSLYTLELFFADGSSKAIDLYATETDVSVRAAQLAEYAEFIEQMQEDAADHGYAKTVAGVVAYHEWERDRADLVENWLSGTAIKALSIIMAALSNWILDLLALGAFVALGYYILSRYGRMLDLLMNDSGKAQRTKEQLETQQERQMQTANEEPLGAVDAIGSDAVYWEDAFGAASPAQLANIAARGVAHINADGDLILDHEGVDDLDASDLRSSWLGHVVGEGRIPNYRQALAQLKAVCEYMSSKHGQGHLYRDAARQADAVLDEWKRQSGLQTHVDRRGTADD